MASLLQYVQQSKNIRYIQILFVALITLQTNTPQSLEFSCLGVICEKNFFILITTQILSNNNLRCYSTPLMFISIYVFLPRVFFENNNRKMICCTLNTTCAILLTHNISLQIDLWCKELLESKHVIVVLVKSIFCRTYKHYKTI